MNDNQARHLQENNNKLEGAEIFHAQACGKAILIGEHAVVYGASAVAIPLLDMQMKISLRRISGSQSRLCLGRKEVSKHVSLIIGDAFRVLGIQPQALSIEGTSDVLIGSGLGSSAALSNVILRAVAKAFEVELKPSLLAKMATELECRFHGKSSGLDTTTVAYQQAILFKKGQEAIIPKILAPPGAQAWHLALIDSETRSSTLAMINIAAPYFQDDAHGCKRLQKFEYLAGACVEALGTGNVELLAQTLNEASTLLTKAGLLSQSLHDIIVRSKKIGVKAAKLTGAGGGGCILVLLKQECYAIQLDELKQEFGANRVHAAKLLPTKT